MRVGRCALGEKSRIAPLNVIIIIIIIIIIIVIIIIIIIIITVDFRQQYTYEHLVLHPAVEGAVRMNSTVTCHISGLKGWSTTRNVSLCSCVSS